MDQAFTAVANRVSGWAGRPATFVIALAIIIGWGLSGPLFQWSDTWQLVVNTGTTIITFLMVFLIQNSQNRDAAAMQAKLDELIRATKGAHNRLIALEEKGEEALAAAREELRDLPDGDAPEGAGTALLAGLAATRDR